MTSIVRHDDESVKERFIKDGGKEVKLFTSVVYATQWHNRRVMTQRKHEDVFEVILLLGAVREIGRGRGHPGLNQRPLDLRSRMFYHRAFPLRQRTFALLRNIYENDLSRII
ncbi:hypothetical protein TNCV_2260891 [Trichonephila clavipes]|nr:hypothetical protein TNCV_2260891 [Trichonephila clavipes]